MTFNVLPLPHNSSVSTQTVNDLAYRSDYCGIFRFSGKSRAGKGTCLDRGVRRGGARVAEPSCVLVAVYSASADGTLAANLTVCPLSRNKLSFL